MKLRICQVNRQSLRGRFGWLCVTNNGDCLCDDLRGGAEVATVVGGQAREIPRPARSQLRSGHGVALRGASVVELARWRMAAGPGLIALPNVGGSVRGTFPHQLPAGGW